MRYIIVFILLLTIIFSINCASVSGGLKTLPEPENGSMIIIGNILLENIDRDLSFTYWGFPLRIVIVGKDDNGNLNHYTVTTSDRGYYILPNLPKGSYILKAVIFQEPGFPPNIIVNDWTDANSKFYLMRHPERGIEYSAEWFPPESQSRLINENILWFGLRLAAIENMSELSTGVVMVTESSETIKDERFWRDGHQYSREAPLTYYKHKFPDSKWWQR